MSEQTKDMDQEACRVIDAMGGTAEVARIFETTMQSVSQWRYGIPKARLQTMKLMRPDLFEQAA